MKQFFQSAIVVITLGFAVVAPASAEELVIKKLNSDKVVSKYWKMVDLYEEIKEEEVKIQKEGIDGQNEIKVQNDEILKMGKQLQDPKLPKGERQNLESLYRRKFDRLNNTKKLQEEYIKGKFKALKVQLDSRRQELLVEVRKVVLDYAAKNGIDAIYDEKQLVFMKDKFDISEKIIEIINKDKPVDKATETEEPAGDVGE